jgi:TolB-like protein/cytochrome c-type biogenesis protein CcmH/NrfG
MGRSNFALASVVRELRRRRVFRTAGLYIVGAWLLMQAADLFFPGWGLPEAAINVLLLAAILGFPLALVFGWFFDITASGIVRTSAQGGDSNATALRRSDYLLLGLIAAIAVIIAYDATDEILDTPRLEADPLATSDNLYDAEKLPNSIAVLPFINISDDPNNEFFCDGISEEILNKLAGFAELRVTGRRSSFVFKDSDYDLRRIAALLGVRYLLQGSVRKQAGQLRISAQLIGGDSVQQWSATFDRELKDVFEIQSEIADIVAQEVVPQVSLVAHSDFRPDLDAYEHFLKGRELVYLRRSRDAVPALAKAIELNPEYAEAHAEYAIALMLGSPSEADMDKARAAVDTALELRPELPRALAARGFLLETRTPPDHAGAVEALHAALERDPNMMDAMNWIQGALSFMGHNEEADEWLEKAYRVDPLHPAIATNYAERLRRHGDRKRERQILERLADIPDPSSYAFIGLRDLNHNEGRLVDLNLGAKERALRASFAYYDLALSYALIGRWKEVERWVERSQHDASRRLFAPFYPSLPPYFRGDYEEAAAVFEKILASRNEDVKAKGENFRIWLGELQGLAGDCHAATTTLGSTLDHLRSLLFGNVDAIEAVHALAWACRNERGSSATRRNLEFLETKYEEFVADGSVMKSIDMYLMARNAALLNQPQLALERLRLAIDAGWREYYIRHKDPRWNSLREHPEFQAMMTEVKADVDRQRAEIDRLDAEEDFPALLDRVHGSTTD